MLSNLYRLFIVMTLTPCMAILGCSDGEERNVYLPSNMNLQTPSNQGIIGQGITEWLKTRD